MIPSGFAPTLKHEKMETTNVDVRHGPVQLAVVPKRRDCSKNRNSHTLVAEIPTSPMKRPVVNLVA
jgi:hypothetical protein